MELPASNRMEKVINCFKKRPDAVARLICFPWAGGGSIHYARWGNVLSSSVEVFAVKLPGRESRAKEPFFQSMQQIVDEVIGVLLPMLKEKPFALFGHRYDENKAFNCHFLHTFSLFSILIHAASFISVLCLHFSSFGAFTSFAVADALKKLHNLEPVHIFLSGASAPYSETRITAPKRSELSDDDFLKWLISIGGTPPELLANPEVLKLFLPALKADLHVVENYRCNKPDHPFLSCPVTCFDGKDDIPHDLQAWKDITSGDFTVRMLDGSHFYLKESGNEKIILDYVTKHLETSEMDYL
uniref:oleoyl-[acyl-carrier-protein] hydrolase n=1 Tax=Lates calcarifer TaxID=8187 RepID=A0A4W6EGN2_LATCA